MRWADLSLSCVPNAHPTPRSVVVSDLDVVGISIDEPETDTPLVIDRDGVLSLPIAAKCVKPVPRWDLQIVETGGQVHVLKLPDGPLDEIGWEAFRLPFRVQDLGAPISERLDHTPSVLRHVTRVTVNSGLFA